MQKILKTRFTTDESILTDIMKGGRFVQFQYMLFFFVGYAVLPTRIYYIPSDKKAIFSWGGYYLLLCLFLGFGYGLFFYKQRNVTENILNAYHTSREQDDSLVNALQQINKSIKGRMLWGGSSLWANKSKYDDYLFRDDKPFI